MGAAIDEGASTPKQLCTNRRAKNKFRTIFILKSYKFD
jgi:hypothetical protein